MRAIAIICCVLAMHTAEMSGGMRGQGITGRTYYLDSQNGSDLNDGSSPSEAWKSLEMINRTVFSPGDSILIRRSTEYRGHMELKGNGTESRPIVVAAWGSGKKPAIHGGGTRDYTILIRNCMYWEVCDLEITNEGNERKGGRRGVLLSSSDFGDMRHIHLKGLSIHNVNGSLRKSEGGGSAIMVSSMGKDIKSRFIDLLIERCHIYDCERNGISFSGMSSRNAWYPSLGVVIRGNLLERIPGDGIVPIACDGALVEENIMRDSPDMLPPGEAAAGIWPWGSDNTVIRYNEVSGHKAKWDGQGFDADYNCINTIFQYNYSHDNYGGFFLVCNDGGSLGRSWNKGTENVTIENNVSINDGIRPYPTRSGWLSPSFHITGPVKGVRIRYNYVIMPSREEKMSDTAVIRAGNWGDRWPSDVQVYENVFMLGGSYITTEGESADFGIRDNVIMENIPDSTLYMNAESLTLLQKILEKIRYVDESDMNPII